MNTKSSSDCVGDHSNANSTDTFYVYLNFYALLNATYMDCQSPCHI